jgi:hypothetical protein
LLDIVVSQIIIVYFGQGPGFKSGPSPLCIMHIRRFLANCPDFIVGPNRFVGWNLCGFGLVRYVVLLDGMSNFYALGNPDQLI